MPQLNAAPLPVGQDLHLGGRPDGFDGGKVRPVAGERSGCIRKDRFPVVQGPEGGRGGILSVANQGDPPVSLPDLEVPFLRIFREIDLC